MPTPSVMKIRELVEALLGGKSRSLTVLIKRGKRKNGILNLGVRYLRQASAYRV